MDKRYQIFVSSTYSDLKEEREAVIHALWRSKYIAVAMEQFPATDEAKLKYICRIIDESDYYVVIIRGKYGSLTNDGISFTEQECDYAIERKKPVLAFLFKSPGKLPVDDTEKDQEKSRKLDAFRKKLENRPGFVNYWENCDQLVNAIKDSIRENEKTQSGIGWIRGDRTIGSSVYNDKADIVFPLDCAHGSDLFEIAYTVSERSNDNKIIEKESGDYKISWDMLFEKLAELIRLEEGDDSILRKLREIIRENNNIDGKLIVNIKSSYLEQARHQLEALGLIEAISKTREINHGLMKTVNDVMGIPTNYIAWTLTDKGRRYISKLRALKRPPVS